MDNDNSGPKQTNYGRTYVQEEAPLIPVSHKIQKYLIFAMLATMAFGVYTYNFTKNKDTISSTDEVKIRATLEEFNEALSPENTGANAATILQNSSFFTEGLKKELATNSALLFACAKAANDDITISNIYSEGSGKARVDMIRQNDNDHRHLSLMMAKLDNIWKIQSADC